MSQLVEDKVKFVSFAFREYLLRKKRTKKKEERKVNGRKIYI